MISHDESQLQILFTRWLDSHKIHYVVSLMGVNLGARAGKLRKQMGCRAGVHDIIILHARAPYNGMTLELKVKGGKITPEQVDFKMRSELNGYYSVIMPPKFEVMEALEWAIKEVEYYLSDKK